MDEDLRVLVVEVDISLVDDVIDIFIALLLYVLKR
jgi:hypothetical protein